MDKILELFGLTSDSGLGAWVSFLIALTLMLLLGKLLHGIAMKQLERITARTEAKWDDELIANIKRPTFLMLVSFLVYFSIQLSQLPFKSHTLIESVLRGVFIICLFWTIERVIYSLVKHNTLMSSLADSTRTLVSTIIRAGILIIGLLMVLDSAGISITPLLASLGVGSVAVALALQDTLSNLFSGLYILADKPFQMGDFVEIEGGMQGYVTKVGWRSSHIRTAGNNIVVIPNSKMASSIMTNFDLDDGETVLQVPVGVAYASDLEKVESLTLQVARDVLKKYSPMIRTYEPFIRYREFADSSINFIVYLRAVKYDDTALLRHEFIKALHKAYAQAGVDIPFPQRVIHTRGPNA